MTTEISLRLRDLKPEYQKLWNRCEIKPENLNQTQEIVTKICLTQNRYQALQREINVPWYFIAVIHNMESSLNFTKHLHNGDSLKKRTVKVPSGRPIANPSNGWEVGYTWEESAIDALTLKEFDKVKDWSLAAQLWQLEKYNGFGYRQYHPEVLTPYLWSGTYLYTKGKYKSDDKWDANAISAQIGVAALLKILIKVENLQIPLV
jgi:lysozyme family protein